jgi:hypothetical protein
MYFQNMFAEIMSRNGYNTDAASSAEEGVEGPDGGEAGGVESPAAKHHPSSARAHGGLPTSTYRSFVAYYEGKIVVFRCSLCVIPFFSAQWTSIWRWCRLRTAGKYSWANTSSECQLPFAIFV